MDNILNQNATPAAEQETGGKTFTQDDVNRIVSDRLAKDRAKNEAELNEREQELAQRELRMTAKEMLSEKGLPVQLLDALNCTDKDTVNKSIKIIENVINDKIKNAAMPTLKGLQPGLTNADVQLPGDGAIRAAMGLSARKE